jgi:EAL domain-containing protein (putative c-di-GMP-specific phosphodiesterase class I)
MADRGHTNMANFFHQLTPPERFAIFEQQNQIADALFEQSGIRSSVNIDNGLVELQEFRNKVLASIRNSSAPTTYEFTEVYPMPPPELMNPVFRVLRDNGKRSALDDFGTGFNGMSLFFDFDFDVVKIDRSLIVDIDTRPAKLKVLGLIGQMIETLGKEHVVEGVETQSQSDRLHGCGFHTFQGYLLHRPEAIERFFEMRCQPVEVLQ